MQHKNIRQWLDFYEQLYRHLDSVEYTPGVMMLFKAFPVKVQAHFIDLNDDNEKLPDSSVFKAY